YDFYPDKSEKRSLYISNHDQTNPKHIGLLLENARNIVVDGNGSDFVFHGRMLPFAVRGCKNVTLRNFSIDFENPHIAQVTVVRSDDSGISFNPAPWVKWRINKSGVFETSGHGWNAVPVAGIAFEPDTRQIVYRTSDLSVPLDSVVRNSDGSLHAPRWIDKRLVRGTVVALRTYDRPAPGIFLDENKDTRIENVQVRYAEGMGLLAQLCSNISLDGFSVCLRGEDDPRYFTTQADATHFSACEGLIDSRNGLYEGMMDDAINVHGTYLRITFASADGRVVHGRYMHPQAYGFKWGEPGDSVQFVLSRTMEIFGDVNVIDSVVPMDASSQDGAKEFRITLRKAIDLPLSEPVGIENLRLTP
ncbi:MAG: alpha-1,3-galactosidase B, partial [Muribaculaceae bacterium]|nr:alpha-1,3-galactosidase B [Muribaculaceae bacterium]